VHTLVAVLFQVLLVDVEVVVGVQLPELAVDDIEMFVGEELGQLVHVFFLLQQRQILREKKKKKKVMALRSFCIIICDDQHLLNIHQIAHDSLQAGFLDNVLATVLNNMVRTM